MGNTAVKGYSVKADCAPVIADEDYTLVCGEVAEANQGSYGDTV